MKRIFAFLAIAALAACNNPLSPDSGITGVENVPKAPQGGEVFLTVATGAPSTKVASQSEVNEKTIWNVQVFVFRAGGGADDGVLEIAKSEGVFDPVVPSAGDAPLSNTGGYDGITVKCSTGYREVWVVCNDSKDHTKGTDAIMNKAEFLALTHNLENSSPSKFLMIGRSNPDSDSPVVNLTEGASRVNVPVHRLAACIVLEDVENDMLSPAYQKQGVFRLDAAYLLNVPGWIDYGEISSATDDPSPFDKWYAKLAPEITGNRAAILYDKIGGASGSVVEYGTHYSTPHTFYAYRNDCVPSQTATFAPRSTVLVLEASIKYKTSTGVDSWMTVYYPVTIATVNADGTLQKGIQANKKYHVTLKVNRPGSTDPNIPVTFHDLTPNITVSDWIDGDTYSPVI